MQDRKPGNQTRQPLEACPEIGRNRIQLSDKRNIRLTVAFEGTRYHGWQMQRDSPTIQGLISDAIAKITGERVNLIGSGRTDAGTHARALVANFLTQSMIAPAQLGRALNGVLPGDIRIVSARKAPLDFHARRDAISKTYRYQVYLGSILVPHLAREYFHYPYRLQIAPMQQAVRLFLGEHDFASFAKTNASHSSTVRHIFRCELKKKGFRLFLTVQGNGFLHHMVRNMAGTLIEVGKGSISLEQFQDLFVKRDRRLAGFTAPAHGLVLLKVQY
jgi:tRNA pseudouridine38-40 synthase